MEVSLSLLSGIITGLALAIPLGAIGLLLVQEGLTRGLLRGLPGAAAVATVDIAYCAAAVTMGTFIGPAFNGWTPWPQILGGSTLIAIAVHGLLKSRHTKVQEGNRTTTRSGTALKRYTLFLGLTALNPLTLVYFTAILPGLEQLSQSTSAAVAFVVGVGMGSMSWQALLVSLGAILGRKTGPSFRSWTSTIGNSLVVILGALLVLQTA